MTVNFSCKRETIVGALSLLLTSGSVTLSLLFCLLTICFPLHVYCVVSFPINLDLLVSSQKVPCCTSQVNFEVVMREIG